jgi:hypothetical protein
MSNGREPTDLKNEILGMNDIVPIQANPQLCRVGRARNEDLLVDSLPSEADEFRRNALAPRLVLDDIREVLVDPIDPRCDIALDAAQIKTMATTRPAEIRDPVTVTGVLVQEPRDSCWRRLGPQGFPWVWISVICRIVLRSQVVGKRCQDETICNAHRSVRRFCGSHQQERGVLLRLQLEIQQYLYS